VDLGSPAWEAGLTEGDEVRVFAFNARDFLYDPQRAVPEGRRKAMGHVGSAEECLARLQRPVPGKQFYFQLKRPGEAKLFETQTTVRQRPLWRFFPTKDNEWVLWRWRDYYYDTSTHGDSYISWQVFSDPGKVPDFYRAEQFRDRFHRPDKVAATVRTLAA